MDEPNIVINALTEANITFRCTWAAGGDEAFEKLKALTPDLIMLDFNMPRINGIEVLRMLKESELFRQIPVIMYSATMDRELIQKAMRFGAVECIRKPYNMSELPGLLKNFL